MEYEFSQKWTKEDYVAFATNHLFINFFKLQNIILYSISVGYLLITPIITKRWEFFYVGIGLFFLMGAFVLFARRNAGKGYERNKESLSINFVLNDSGLTYETKEGTLTEEWSKFYMVKETTDYFFMYFAAHQGFLLAKRDLSEDMMSFMRKNLQDHVVNQKKLKFLK